MNRFCSLLSQVLKSVPRVYFEREVRKLNAERHAHGMSCWQQSISMLFCPLGRAHSLHEIEQALRGCERDSRTLCSVPLICEASRSSFSSTDSAVAVQTKGRHSDLSIFGGGSF